MRESGCSIQQVVDIFSQKSIMKSGRVTKSVISKKEKSINAAEKLALKIKQRSLEEEQNNKKDTNGLKKQDVNNLESDSSSSESVDQLDKDSEKQIEKSTDDEDITFSNFGLVPEILESTQRLNFSKPTPIQREAIPHALEGRDIIGLAQTGSGKTAAFAIPILQSLWEKQTPYFACVLAPTRELAFQIKETFDALGSSMGCKTVCIVGGLPLMDQARDLVRKPHIIVATPGRLVEHLKTTKGFNLKKLQYFVMDEADRLLELEFGPALDEILKVIPTERKTYLFSATMTDKVKKLQKTSLKKPILCAVDDKYTTVDTLVQSMILTPIDYKNTYLIHLLNHFTGKTIIIFTRTIVHCQRTAILGRMLGFPIVPLHGQLSQSKRLGALNSFKSGSKNILVATDVAARGLDIPSVDLVINYDMPTDSKTYIHRVGRTARAGRSGKSISLVTQYDLELLLRIEKALNKKLPAESIERDEVNILHPEVDKATTATIRELKLINEEDKRRGRGSHRRHRDNGNDREEQ